MTRLELPEFGLGTWCMGRNAGARGDEVRALRVGLDLGVRMIDTAEMYDDAESVVGEALRGRRDDVILVSKVLPSNASRQGTIDACERSLRRLDTDVIDLYLLHWESSYPIQETIDAFLALRDTGKIRAFGVSNFDVDALDAAMACNGGDGIVANQILYNLSRRETEHRLLPWCRHRGVSVMAYSPFEQGRLDFDGALREVAARHDATSAQIALAWVLAQPGVVTIPKSSREDHVRENVAALTIELADEDRRTLDRAFPPPTGPRPLPVL